MKKGENDFKEIHQNEPSKNVIDNANKYFLLKILSPEITNNESKKREHKDYLIKIVKMFLIVQFFLLTILLLGTIGGVFVFHGIKNDLELKYIETIIKFVSIYITATVVELIAMLNYIVKSVFDASITDLVRIYNNKEQNSEPTKTDIQT